MREINNLLFFSLVIIFVTIQSAAQRDTGIFDPESFEAPLPDLSTLNLSSLKPGTDMNFSEYQLLILKDREISYARDLSLGVLAFGLILAIFSGIIAIRTGGWNREATIVFTVSLIVTGGLFLMTAGFSDEQVAPMFGLMGTIVGYLLGRGKTFDEGSKSDDRGSKTDK